MEIENNLENVRNLSQDSPYVFLSLNLYEPTEVLEAQIKERILGSQQAKSIQIYLDLLRSDQDYGDGNEHRLEQNSQMIVNRLEALVHRCSAFNIQYPFFTFCRELERSIKALLAKLTPTVSSLKLLSYVLKDVHHNHEIIYSLRDFSNLQNLTLRFELPADWLVFPCLLPRSLRKIALTLSICSLSGYLFKTFDNLPFLEDLSLKLIILSVKHNCLPLTELYVSNFRSPELKRSIISFMPFNSPSMDGKEIESVEPEVFFTLTPALIMTTLNALSSASPISKLEHLSLLWCFDASVDGNLILKLLLGLTSLRCMRSLTIDLHQKASSDRVNPSFVDAIKRFMSLPEVTLDKLTINFHKGKLKPEDYANLVLSYDIQRCNIKRYELFFDNVEALELDHTDQARIISEIFERFDRLLLANSIKITGVLRGFLRYFSCRNTFDSDRGEKDFREIYVSDPVLRSNPYLDKIIIKSLELLERYPYELSAINLHFDPRGNPLHINILKKIDDVLLRYHNLHRINVDISERTLSIVEKHKNLTFLCLMTTSVYAYDIRDIVGLLKRLPFLTFFDTLNLKANERNLVKQLTQGFFKEKAVNIAVSYALRGISRQFKVRQEIKNDLFMNFLSAGLSHQLRFFKGGF